MNRDSDQTSGNNPTRVTKVDDSIKSSKRRSYPFTLLDRYEVQAPIGSGGMGDVVLAEDTALSRHVAIKWIRGDLAQSQQAIQRFYQEAKAAAALNHPNIVQIYDRGSDDGDDFFVMEYVDGESLAQRLKRGPLDLDECVRIAMAVCDALQAAHDNGIVHRDVKPANMVLTVDGIPKLTDFGVARLGADSEMTIAGSTVGTLVYMAPEQENDAAGASPMSDQYSLAVTLYHMLTGEAPRRILERSIPDVLRDVVIRATDPVASSRFASIAAFKAALATAVGVEEYINSSESPAETLKRQNQQTENVHIAAQRLVAENDWLLARTTLKQLPKKVRTEDLWNEISEKAKRIDSLNESISIAVKNMQYTGLNLAIQELIELQPQRTDLHDLMSHLAPTDIVILDEIDYSESVMKILQVSKLHPALSDSLKHQNRNNERIQRIIAADLDPLSAEKLREMLDEISPYLQDRTGRLGQKSVNKIRSRLVRICHELAARELAGHQHSNGPPYQDLGNALLGFSMLAVMFAGAVIASEPGGPVFIAIGLLLEFGMMQLWYQRGKRWEAKMKKEADQTRSTRARELKIEFLPAFAREELEENPHPP